MVPNLASLKEKTVKRAKEIEHLMHEYQDVFLTDLPSNILPGQNAFFQI